MTISEGAMLIGGEWIHGSGVEITSFEAATGKPLDPAFKAGGQAEIDRACSLAEAAFDSYRALPLEVRASFLEAIATEIEALGDDLIVKVMAESGLPRGRLEGERGRTMGQLRMFADVVRRGEWQGIRHDPALPDRQPAPRPDLKLRNIGLGPVAVFGASNFPLAFSVAGGDTASALAAGCPVVVKAHPAHLGTSALIASAIDRAAKASGVPEGTFALVIGEGNDFGAALVADPRIKAVGFTGSRGGGTALMAIAAARSEPIPVYAEMSSINPVLLFPNALATRGGDIGKAFAASLTLGSGQFCTNPGLIIALAGEALDHFVAEAGAALADIAPSTMLTPGIHAAYLRATDIRSASLEASAEGPAPDAPYAAQSLLYRVDAKRFLAEPKLHEEIFGPAALVVACTDMAEMRALMEAIEGQLTIALHIDVADHEAAAALLPLLERKTGRLLVNGFGTGVEVADAMVHGGPWPATSDGRSTSVGSLAIARFLRPVCYQDFPEILAL